MTCDDTRQHLAEHLLGTLEAGLDAEVSAHLRGCAACRADAAALGEGLGSFSRASHDREPPPELRERVRTVLEDEWAATPLAVRRRPTVAWIAAAAALVAALAWAGFSTARLQRAESAAERYESFLAVLGGDAVRVGEMRGGGPQSLQGSAVIYDSHVGQSWVLVLCRAPGWSGTANVTLRAPSGETVDLHPMEFDAGGEGATWLVTPADLSAFDRVNVWDERGVIASASLEDA